MLALERQPMARKAAEATVRLEADLARLAKVVASFEDRTITEVLGEILRPALQRRYEDHLRRAQSELAPPAPGPKAKR